MTLKKNNWIFMYCMKKNDLKKIIKECIEEIQSEHRIRRKREIIVKADEIIKKIKEIGKKEFGI